MYLDPGQNQPHLAGRKARIGNAYRYSNKAIQGAHERLEKVIHSSEQELNLAEAALLVAKDEYPGLDVDAYLRRLDELATAGILSIAKLWFSTSAAIEAANTKPTTP